ncbi:MAG: hypothetical protein JWO69_1404 [Thermoleophilia bacterium]|nr:hypothetical protein [Thermoleophilia bacterium]
MPRELEQLLGPDEGIVLQTRQHWFVIFRDIGVLVLGLALIAVAIWYVGEAGWLDNRVGGWVEVALWIGFAAALAIVLWRVLSWFLSTFYLTTSKVVYVHGVLNRAVTSTPMVKVDEVTLNRPLLGRMLGFGRLDVENASGGHEPLAGLEYLPRPAEIYRVLTERSRHQRMIEGGAHRDDDRDGIADPAASQTPPAAPAEPDAGWQPPGDSTSSR